MIEEYTYMYVCVCVHTGVVVMRDVGGYGVG